MVQLPDRLAIIDSNLLSDRPFLVDHMTGVFVRLIVKHNIPQNPVKLSIFDLI